MSRFWSTLAHNLQPYVPGEQPMLENLVKLNTNESPFPPSPKVLAAMQQATNEQLRRYPDPTCRELRQALADQHQLSIEQVIVGNGSDEVLGHAFQALLKQDSPILFPDITYGFYPVFAQLFGIAYQSIPLAADFSIQVNDYHQPNGGIIIANPNAPTGMVLGLDKIEQLLQQNPNRVVIIDEAYVDFGGQSAIGLINDYDNLLVVQTFSKSRALAGLRVGMAFGQAHLIAGIDRVKNSFNPYPLSREALAGATASVQDDDYFQTTVQKVIILREYVSTVLTTLGFQQTDSNANFIFVKHSQHTAAHLAEQLRQQGIIIRHLTAHPRTAQYLRISIGNQAECDRLLMALKDMVD